MNEHTLCCGTVADKAKLFAEIAERDLRIKNLEMCEDARARVAGRTLKFAMERGYNPASEENELEYIMRRFDEMAAQAEAVIFTKESTYKAFIRFCESNRHYDLDPRLHTHGGGISVGGYISDGDTAKMFAAFKCGVAWASSQRIQEANHAPNP